MPWLKESAAIPHSRNQGYASGAADNADNKVQLLSENWTAVRLVPHPIAKNRFHVALTHAQVERLHESLHAAAAECWKTERRKRGL